MKLDSGVCIGIDPGVNGGLAAVDVSTGLLVAVEKMPASHRRILDFLETFRGPSPAAVIELVHSSPLMGVVSAFTFGKGYGSLLMALEATGVPYAEVTPQVWQKTLGCLTRGDKNVSKARAAELFPDVKVTHAIADALLIAWFCRVRRATPDAVVQAAKRKKRSKGKAELERDFLKWEESW